VAKIDDESGAASVHELQPQEAMNGDVGRGSTQRAIL
jgi:hypothetical protein